MFFELDKLKGCVMLLLRGSKKEPSNIKKGVKNERREKERNNKI
jgi:hypothetical protein